MLINADHDKPASVHAHRIDWVPSPSPGVERKMLERVGGEVARATTIVRYAAGSTFPAHVHHGGEEFLVLEGVFEDEHGRYPEGTYVRNPPGTRHAPGSGSGCTIFVKLHQFPPDDRVPLVMDTSRLARAPHGLSAPRIVSELFRSAHESVRLEYWKPEISVPLTPVDGVEILCLDGSFSRNGEAFTAHSWIRLPAGEPLDIVSGPEGCRVWIKEGHLRKARSGKWF